MSKETIADKINNKINNIYKEIEDLAENINNKTEDKINSYKWLEWRKVRPDLTLIIELCIFLLFIILILRIIPLITRWTTSTDNIGFSQDEYKRA